MKGEDAGHQRSEIHDTLIENWRGSPRGHVYTFSPMERQSRGQFNMVFQIFQFSMLTKHTASQKSR